MIRTSTLHAIERLLLATLLLLAATEAVAQSDAAGSRDHPLFNRMAGYWIEDYEASDFNSRVFLVKTTGDEWEEKTVEGKKTEITYRLREGTKEPSSLQVVRNYVNAAAQAGGKVVYQNDDPGNRVATLFLVKGGRETWVEVRGADGGGWYTLAIVEKGVMAQEISAGDIYDALAKQGRIALYILFDTGKATIKPESQPIVKQVADMMKAHPEVKVSVEGHTDNVGAPASNKVLSEQRAGAVVAAIVAQGVAGERLGAAGFGQDKPVASNATDDGRAKNRRVELVRR